MSRPIQLDAAFTDRAIGIFPRLARERLDRVVGIARAAEICSEIGQVDEAVRISLDIEPLLTEVKHLVNTARIMRGLAQT